MLEVVGDLWTYPADWRCVTTNGIVKSNGELVMGAGVALEAKRRFPDLPKMLGDYVKKHGNLPAFFHEYHIISFPTKNDWRNKSDLALIRDGARMIVAVLNVLGLHDTVALTRPGCGNGGLEWDDVRKAISGIFDNRFVVVNNA